jgi:Flp pilus assembly protein TadG
MAGFAALRRPEGERGSFAIIVVFWSLIVMALAGLVVDGGLSITERQRAGDLAEQAARVGANDLDPDQLRQGIYQLAGDACTKAGDFIVASGLARGSAVCTPDGTTVSATGKTVPTIKVTVHIQYSPILVGMFYTGNMTATASANAHPEPGN